MMMIDDLLIYYSDKYIYVNIIHTSKYVLIIHYTQPNKAYQSLFANTYKLIVLLISKHPVFITESIMVTQEVLIILLLSLLFI